MVYSAPTELDRKGHRLGHRAVDCHHEEHSQGLDVATLVVHVGPTDWKVHHQGYMVVGYRHEGHSQGWGMAKSVVGADPRGQKGNCSLLGQHEGVDKAVGQKGKAWELGVVGPCLSKRGCGLEELDGHLGQGCRGSMARTWSWKPRRLVVGMAERGCLAQALDL